MKIIDSIKREAISADLKAEEKIGVLEELARPIATMAGIEEKELVRDLLERESLGSTGIGGGVGIPHCKRKDVDAMLLGFGLSQKGVDFDSIDARPVHIFFALITPEDEAGLHLKLLSRISRLLKNDLFKQKLLRARSRDEIYEIIKMEEDALQDGDDI
ncbi:PTS fructose transporter subunit IIA [Candidatus Desulfarcum epimagneticum]|uniref:PTS fructose transporter subunit IIA n=1 Tax=uncultured Desulfobacteraceae bacterium TaxID=218296 RepID=A0A484HJ04_9BACT|nr:PTS fructose transporter subunit IIA [uncultured Desulfobacteraceae bacterium]